MSSDKNAGPWVYFIQAGEGGPIKIGWTGGNPLARLRDLQTGNHEPLKLRGCFPGTFEDEQALHARFASSRMTGEWFKVGPELAALVDGVALASRRRPDPVLPREDERYFSLEQGGFLRGMVDTAIACREAAWIAAIADAGPSGRIDPRFENVANDVHRVLRWVVASTGSHPAYQAGAAEADELCSYDLAFAQVARAIGEPVDEDGGPF